MKNSLVVAAATLFVLILIGPSLASPSPASVLYVKPTNGEGAGPWVITSPAPLEIGMKPSSRSKHGAIKGIWLMLILNENTKINLESISARDATGNSITSDFLPGDFIDPDDPNNPENKIPRTDPDEYGDGYPGSNEQYNVDTLKTEIYGSATDTTILYFVKRTSIVQITKDYPVQFTLTVNAPDAAQMKVMVLALGYSGPLEEGKLNEATNLSNYTFVVPEIAAVFLALAPVAGFGLYAYKEKKTNKNKP